MASRDGDRVTAVAAGPTGGQAGHPVEGFAYLAGRLAQAWAATCGRSHSMAPVVLSGGRVPVKRSRNAPRDRPLF